MRRIATIAATAAAAAAVFALAAPANAATTNTWSSTSTYGVNTGANQASPAATKWHNWTAHSVGEGSAYGTYAKVGSTVYVYGRVHDSHTDSYRVCLEFDWYYHGTRVGYDKGCILGGHAGTAIIRPAIKGPSYAQSMYNRLYIEKGNTIVKRGAIHKVY